MTRKTHLRGIDVLCDCGHAETLVTPFFRLTEQRASDAYDHAVRNGMFCLECCEFVKVIEYLGTCSCD